MPNIKSAMKRLRSDSKRTLQNRMRKSRVKTYEKKFLTLVQQKDAEAAAVALSKCFSEYDKAAKVGTIHQNKADRKKARLTKRLKSLD